MWAQTDVEHTGMEAVPDIEAAQHTEGVQLGKKSASNVTYHLTGQQQRPHELCPGVAVHATGGCWQQWRGLVQHVQLQRNRKQGLQGTPCRKCVSMV